MSRHLADAILDLRGRGIIPDARAGTLLRIARRELVPVRLELQAALYAGVLLIVAGIGALVKGQLQNLGPVTIGLGIAGLAAACFVFVARSAPRFSRGPVPSPSLAFDYVLLLGVLLLGADLAYLEVQFKALGPQWPWHLLIVALLQLALAYRYDARGILSLALASFAAWRGVAVALPHRLIFEAVPGQIRLNALGCGALFLAAGLAGKARGWKAHFEPVFGNLGLALLLGASVSGIFSGGGAEGSPGLWWAIALPTAGAAIVLGYRRRRVDYFGQGVIAAYLVFLRAMAALHVEAGGLFFVALSSLAVVGLLVWAHRHMREEP